MSTVRKFMEHHYLHYNARETLAAAKAWEAHVEAGGKMMVTLAGAMSTARIGRILGRLIKKGFVHAITCTGANLEEDVFNLVAANDYKIIADWRSLSTADEQKLYDQGYNRVTDTCIPETVMRHIEKRMYAIWDRSLKTGERHFPFEWFREIMKQPDLKKHFQIPTTDSWMYAAMEKGLPIFTPGWEDSTLGNMFSGWCMKRGVEAHTMLRGGTESMVMLAHWYRANCGLPNGGAAAKTQKGGKRGGKAKLEHPSVGFFQIGGGIAGDFPICAVPMMVQDLEWEDTPFWGYFCQISDAVTSYGGYSGAVPNEKITWGKLDGKTPKFMIQSDATIVAPLIFGYLLKD